MKNIAASCQHGTLSNVFRVAEFFGLELRGDEIFDRLQNEFDTGRCTSCSRWMPFSVGRYDKIGDSFICDECTSDLEDC